MTALADAPAHWAHTTIGDIADVSGGIQKQPSRKPRDNTAPFLRVANVQRGRLDLDDVHRIELFDGDLDRYRLEPGDLLVVEGNGSLQHIGRSALWNGEIPDCVHQNHLIRVRPGRDVFPRYLDWYWNSPLATPLIQAHAKTTSGLFTLSTSKVKSVPVVLPPWAEQVRIVEALESRLSVITAARGTLHTVRAKADRLRAAVYGQFYVDAADSGGSVDLGSLLARIEAGRSFKCPGHPAAPGKPGVLKLGAVTWGEFDPDENKEIPDSIEPDPRWEVRPGDLLIGRANTAELVGATALVRTTRPGLYLSDKTLRLVPALGVPAAWIKAVLAAPQARAAMTAVATGTSDSMRNISQSKIRAVQVPPPATDSAARLELLNKRLSQVRHLVPLLDATSARADVLRRSVLAAAFTGRVSAADIDAPSIDEMEEVVA